MTPAEYREAWAWVHLMLRSTPQARQALIGYLHDLRTQHPPRPAPPPPRKKPSSPSTPPWTATSTKGFPRRRGRPAAPSRTQRAPLSSKPGANHVEQSSPVGAISVECSLGGSAVSIKPNGHPRLVRILSAWQQDTLQRLGHLPFSPTSALLWLPACGYNGAEASSLACTHEEGLAMKRLFLACRLCLLSDGCGNGEIPEAQAIEPEPEEAPPEFSIDRNKNLITRKGSWSARLEGDIGGVRWPHLLWDLERVYVTRGDGVTAPDKTTGKVVWHSPGPGERLLLTDTMLLATHCGVEARADGRWLTAAGLRQERKCFPLRPI